MPVSMPVTLPSGRTESQDFLSPAELADVLHISRKSVYHHIQRGDWPHTRITQHVYFSPADVAAIVRAAANPPEGGFVRPWRRADDERGA